MWCERTHRHAQLADMLATRPCQQWNPIAVSEDATPLLAGVSGTSAGQCT